MQILIDASPTEVAELVSHFIAGTFLPVEEKDGDDCDDCDEQTPDAKIKVNCSNVDADSPQGKLLITLLNNITAKSTKIS